MKTLSILLIALVGLTLVSYAQSADSSIPASQQKVLYYTCIMHPEVHVDQPGDCPKCGMTLQPVYENSPAVTQDGAQQSHHHMNRQGSHIHNTIN